MSLVSDPKPASHFTFPLMLWLLPQLLSLALSAGQFRFSYGWSDPPQAWAVEQMLVIQIFLSGIVIHRTLQDLKFTLLAWLTGSVFLLLSSMLAADSERLWRPIPVLLTWLAIAHGWSLISHRALSNAIFNLWILGGTVLTYSALEFAGRSTPPLLSPITACLSIFHAESLPNSYFPTLLLIAAGVHACGFSIRHTLRPK